MKWVFQLGCDSARYLIISLKEAMARFLTSARNSVSYTLDSALTSIVTSNFIGIDRFFCVQSLPVRRDEVRDY